MVCVPQIIRGPREQEILLVEIKRGFYKLLSLDLLCYMLNSNVIFRVERL